MDLVSEINVYIIIILKMQIILKILLLLIVLHVINFFCFIRIYTCKFTLLMLVYHVTTK